MENTSLHENVFGTLAMIFRIFFARQKHSEQMWMCPKASSACYNIITWLFTCIGVRNITKRVILWLCYCSGTSNLYVYILWCSEKLTCLSFSVSIIDTYTKVRYVYSLECFFVLKKGVYAEWILYPFTLVFYFGIFNQRIRFSYRLQLFLLLLFVSVISSCI